MWRMPDEIRWSSLTARKIMWRPWATRAPLFDIPRGSDATNELMTPTNLALDSRGRVYVADTGDFRVKVYDADGKFLHSIGEFGNGLGEFSRLKGIAVDREHQ